MSVVAKLHDEVEIARRVDELAEAISQVVPDSLLVIGVLKGGYVFMADLVRALGRRGCPTQVDFITLRSYGHAKESTREVELIGNPPADVRDRSVLLVDDILDTGHSLAFARNLLLDQGAEKVWICVLADKPSRREVPFEPDFTGFVVGDRFVVGYGLDYAEDYRYLPYLGTID